MAKAREIIFGCTVATVLVWIGASTAEVYVHDTETNYEYSKANYWVMVTETVTEEPTTEIAMTEVREMTTETETRIVSDCVVIDCETKGDYYEVVIREPNGNEWAYYDDCYLSNGCLLRVQFDGNEIVDVDY